MQNPGPPPGYPPGYPPQRTGPPWGWILGIGCGGCALLVVIVLIGLAWLGKSVKDAAEADRVFDMLMGSSVPPRRRFIQTHAKSVRNLDI